MESIEEFQYEPLNPSKPSIRVVRILPGPADQIISCSLNEIPLQNMHTCLSYAWGDSKANRETISINLKRYSVLPNLWCFLHQAREIGIQELLWIDAASLSFPYQYCPRRPVVAFSIMERAVPVIPFLHLPDSPSTQSTCSSKTTLVGRLIDQDGQTHFMGN